MKYVFPHFLLLLFSFTVLQDKIGVFDKSEDIGHPKMAGQGTYNEKNHSYALYGGGYNIWFARDEFHYVYKKLKGDFTLTGNFQLMGKGKVGHRKTGWMIRESLSDSASQISAVIHADSLTLMQWRVAKGMNMRDPEDQIFAKGKGYVMLQLERKGKTITMRAATKPGLPLELIGSHDMDNLPDEVYVGIFVCSHDENEIEEAVVKDVLIINK
jgi:hypothetical protein